MFVTTIVTICETFVTVDSWGMDFFVEMLTNVSKVVIINVTMMPTVSIMMAHMTVNVKLVFMVMAISTVFTMNCVISKSVMKMPNVNRLKDGLSRPDHESDHETALATIFKGFAVCTCKEGFIGDGDYLCTPVCPTGFRQGFTDRLSWGLLIQWQ